MTSSAPDSDASDGHEIHYVVNDEPQVTREKELTPIQIMERAKIDPNQNYLVRIKGRERESFQDHPTTPIAIHPNDKFITIFTGPVPVSCHERR
jgi:hypothetical protein